jgi:predicted deacylase
MMDFLTMLHTKSTATTLAFELACPDISAYRQGNTGVEGVWHFESNQPGRHVVISALIHGNELCGAWALLGLLQAGVRPACGSLTLMFCNLAAFDRFDPSNADASRFVDEDLNRQWSPERIANPTTQERQRAAQLAPFIAKADWLLDLHSMHERAAPLLLTGIQPRNLLLAKQLAAPQHMVVDAGHKEGVRMRDFGRFGLLGSDAQHADVPATRSLLIECGFHGDVSSRVVAQDMCLRFLVTAGTVSADYAAKQLPIWLQADAPEQWALHVTDAVVAQSEAFGFTEVFQGLEVIAKAGTVIGYQNGDLDDPVCTPYDDCVLVMPSVRQARAGVTVVRFAKRQLLR